MSKKRERSGGRFADGLMKVRDFTEEPEGQRFLIVAASLQMFISGLLFGINSGIGQWSTMGMLSALTVTGMWAFNLKPTLRVFINLQKDRYEQGFDDALDFAKGEPS